MHREIQSSFTVSYNTVSTLQNDVFLNKVDFTR